MVAEVRRGASRRIVAKKFGVSKSQVDRWVARAGDERLDRVDWSDRPSGQRTPHNKCSLEVEEQVLAIRKELKEVSALGEYGDEAIHREMMRQRCPERIQPSDVTVNGSRIPYLRIPLAIAWTSGSLGSTGQYRVSFSGDGKMESIGNSRIGTCPNSAETVAG